MCIIKTMVSHFTNTLSDVCGSDVCHFIYFKNEFPSSRREQNYIYNSPKNDPIIQILIRKLKFGYSEHFVNLSVVIIIY